MNDIPEDSHFAAKFPPELLIDLQNYALEFNQEVNSSHRPFLKIPLPPLSFEAHNIILKNLMVGLGGGRPKGNQPPPPPINHWLTSIFSPLNPPQITHDLPENYMKYLPKFDGDKTRSIEEHMSDF
jgi:hypothetical protein